MNQRNLPVVFGFLAGIGVAILLKMEFQTAFALFMGMLAGIMIGRNS